MNIGKLIEDKELLNEYYDNYLKRGLILKSINSNHLKYSHFRKALHNLEFVDTIKENKKFTDWIIVSLYYSLYHSFLSLLENKGYSSKNHNATIIFIIKNYLEIPKDDLELFNNLKMSEEDAIFYSSLKDSRNKASYSSKIEIILDEDIVDIINKVKEIILKIEVIIK